MEYGAGMRLNQLAPERSGGGGRKDLASSPAEKNAAAKAIELHIEPDTKKAGNHADEGTNAAVKAFDAKDGHGWQISPSLKKAHKVWDRQVTNLMNRLGKEKEALRSANSVISNSDFGVRLQADAVRSPSALDRL